jgi:hypothetical protein
MSDFSQFSDHLASFRQTLAKVYAAGMESAQLSPDERKVHRRKSIQSAMNDLEHFTMQKL